MFLNRPAAARFRALASIISGREFLLEFVILVFYVFFMNKCTNTLYDYEVNKVNQSRYRPGVAQRVPVS